MTFDIRDEVEIGNSLKSLPVDHKVIVIKQAIKAYIVATDDAPSCEVPSRRRTIKPPAWQKDYYMF